MFGEPRYAIMAEHPQRGLTFESKLLDCTGFSYVRSYSTISNYRQDAAKRQTAGIVFTHRPKIWFFAPQGRLVAPIRVKLCRTDGHLGPLGCAKFHV